MFLFAQLKPLQFADGEILMHVFDVSYNNLSGRLPSFLDFTNVPEYAQRGIFIAVGCLLQVPCTPVFLRVLERGWLRCF